MTASLLPLPRAVFYDANGNPLAGGFVNTYISGTTTPATTWQDAAQTTPNANPVPLDSNGSALICGAGAYSFAVIDALGNAVPAYSGVTQDVISIIGISAAMQPIVSSPTTAAAFTALAGSLATINGNLQVNGTATVTGATSLQGVTAAGVTAASLSMTAAPSINLATSIGNAIPSLNAQSVNVTTGSATSWENALSVQLTNTQGHAAAANKVALYAAAEATGAASGDTWAFNPLLKLDAGAVPNAAHQCAEFDIDNSSGTNFNDTESSFGPPAVFGMQVTGLSANRCSSAIAILGNITGGSSPMWNRGITLSNTSVRLASIQDFTSSTTCIDVWGSHTYGLDTQNSGISGAAVRCGNGQPLSWRNAANNADLAVLTMGASNTIEVGGGGQAQVIVAVSGTMAPLNDNGPTCGANGARWNSIWAANGTIQTSDPALKTDIAPVPAAMLSLVNAIHPVTFKWKSGGQVPVQVQREVRVRALESYEITNESVQVVNGVATLVTTQETRQQPAYDEMPVVNPDGTPAMTTIPRTRFAEAHEVQLVHREPRYVTEMQTVTEMQDTPGKRTHWGFLAPDVKAAFDAIGMDFGGYVLGEDGTQSLRPDQLIPVLWKALQEVAADLAAYKAAHP